MRKANPYSTVLEPAHLQKILQYGVKPLPPTETLHVDKHGHIKLFCTRNYERGCLVLRVRVQTAPVQRGADGQLIVKNSMPAALLVIEKVPQEVFVETLDALVDVVRLLYPDRKFVVHRKYPGQKAT